VRDEVQCLVAISLVLFNDFDGVVGRTVVDDDDLIDKRMPSECPEDRSDLFLFIEDTDDAGNFRHTRVEPA
jgi:hypothetical protein